MSRSLALYEKNFSRDFSTLGQKAKIWVFKEKIKLANGKIGFN
jgi:hypothetical protein